ncbi:pyridoxamine 5'-phosphate oxidase family protein [Microbispora sp. NPDC049125]|uniref:pyridoxamine 5'-phosphate oxidase family protein n=1 Tax=Microbispora sp. NPDC049125 TaxID=3154929 RepID=UPI003466EE21
MEASRPYMPGYGVSESAEGLLPWSWAEEKLVSSRNYWVATVHPGGRPHVMPVWGVWHEGAMWFSSGLRSRKVRNLRTEPRCTVTIEDAMDPVVLDGVAAVVTGPAAIERFLGLLNAKYGTSYPIGFLDPEVNATIAVRPARVFGLLQRDFGASPTRWTGF